MAGCVEGMGEPQATEVASASEIEIPNDCYIWGDFGIKFLNIPGVVNWLLSTNDIATVAETGEIYFYFAGRYERCGEQIIRRLLVKAFGDTLNYKQQPILNQNKTNEILNMLKAKSYKHINEFNKGFDPITNAPLLNLNNGVLNLETRKLLPHSSEYLFLYKLHVDYNPAAKCPEYLKWRDETVDQEFHPLIDEMMGAILWPDYRIQKAFMLYGPSRTGKGTLIRILEAMIGPENCSHVALQELASNKFKVANLFGKMLNTFGDLPENVVMDVGYFKALTGEDTVEGEEKFKPAFNFKNTAKLVFSANKLPKLKIEDYAYYNRWVIIPFERSFLGDEDASLKDRLTTDEELSGILNLALDGLDRLRKNNWKLSYTLDSAKIYRRASNSISAFLEDEYEPSSSNYVIKTDLIDAYNDYAKRHGLAPPKSTIAFGKAIKYNTVIPVEETRANVSSPAERRKGVRIMKEAWIGIKRKEDR
jgi:putative DNA primase/helicase